MRRLLLAGMATTFVMAIGMAGTASADPVTQGTTCPTDTSTGPKTAPPGSTVNQFGVYVDATSPTSPKTGGSALPGYAWAEPSVGGTSNSYSGEIGGSGPLSVLGKGRLDGSAGAGGVSGSSSGSTAGGAAASGGNLDSNNADNPLNVQVNAPVAGCKSVAVTPND